MALKASIILSRVLATFEDGRWFQGDWSDRVGRVSRGGKRTPPPVMCYCLAGAIGRAHGAPGGNHAVISRAFEESPAAVFVRDALGVQYNCDIYEWNDKAGRTIGEVISAVKRAIKLAKKAEKAAG